MARINRRLAAIPKAVRDAAMKSLLKQGKVIAADMEAMAPEGITSELKKSVEVIPGNATDDAKADGEAVTIVAGGEKAFYAKHVEHGTRHAHARPFFWPAIRGNKARVARNIKGSISRAAKKHWGK